VSGQLLGALKRMPGAVAGNSFRDFYWARDRRRIVPPSINRAGNQFTFSVPKTLSSQELGVVTCGIWGQKKTKKEQGQTFD
jgi:hypothetical protein